MNILVLSDLHLGFPQSRLTVPYEDSTTYDKFIENTIFSKVKDTLKLNESIDYLILCGDIMDFSLNTYADSYKEASKFFRSVARSKNGKYPLFRNIIYIPGNHDHNIWELVQYERYYIRRLKNGYLPSKFRYIQSGILNVQSSELYIPEVDLKNNSYGNLDTLLGLFKPFCENDHDLISPIPINIVYPNLYIKTSNDNILLTHGHFFFTPWVLVTEIFPKTLGINPDLMSLKDLEEINSPLIKLFWDSLGQSGKLTDSIKDIYNDIPRHLSEKLKLAIDEIDLYLDTEVFNYSKIDPREWATDIFTNFLKRWLVDIMMIGEAYKNDDNCMSIGKVRNLITKYIDYSNRDYEYNNSCDNQELTKIIFGHTHVPMFNYKFNEITCYNTGGWVENSRAQGIIINSKGEIGKINF